MDENILAPDNLFPELRLSVFRFVVTPKGPISLPFFQGSTWRGVIGTALSRLACPWPRVKCRTCTTHGSCAYGFLYEPHSMEKGFSDPPRPYIFSPLGKTGNEITVEMTLIGEALEFLPHILTAWIKAGDMGTGKGGGRFRLLKVLQMDPRSGAKTVYREAKCADYHRDGFLLADFLRDDMPTNPMSITLRTPLRLRNNGKNMGVIDWYRAFFSLAVRLSLLNQRFCGGSRPDGEAWSGIKTFFKTPGLTRDETRWLDWKRYSTRQNRRIPMGGLMGRCRMAPVHTPHAWWKWWQTAALFHLGKGVTMGLGKISLEDSVKIKNQTRRPLKEGRHVTA